MIPVSEWTPDQPALAGGDAIAKNVIPWVNGYKPLPSLSAVSTTPLTARCQGATFSRSNAAATYDYAGDATKLYTLSGKVWTDASRLVGGAYATAVDDYWEYVAYGENIIATNYADAPQVITMGGANFAALGGSPPKARHIAVVKDFVALGNVDDGTARPNRVVWSGINNSTQWTVSASTQSDYQDLVGDGGWVQKIVGGEYGIVFQERAIWRMAYVGSPVIFQFDKIELNRGAYAPQSVVGWGDRVFYLADDGFYMIHGGASSIPIGDGKVDRSFLSEIKTDYNYRINAAIDPINKLVLWAYPGSGSVSGAPNKVIVYNWTVNKWSYGEINTECFVRFAPTGNTLDDAYFSSLNLDTMTTSLDSRLWTGGAQTLAAFSTDHNISTFTGVSLAAQVDTKESQLVKGQRAHVHRVRTLVDGPMPGITVAVGSRSAQSGTVSFDNPQTADSLGFVPCDNNDHYQRFRIATTGEFNFILGVDPVEVTPAGIY